MVSRRFVEHWEDTCKIDALFVATQEKVTVDNEEQWKSCTDIIVISRRKMSFATLN
jgi:hypothetical protein